MAGLQARVDGEMTVTMEIEPATDLCQLNHHNDVVLISLKGSRAVRDGPGRTQNKSDFYNASGKEVPSLGPERLLIL